MTLETLSQLFEFNTTKYNKPDLLIYRGRDGAFHHISSNEFRDRVVNFALGLKTLGVKQGTKVLILSENRPKWHVTDFACHLLSAVVVPLFPTLVAEQVAYIVNHSGAEIVVVSSAEQFAKVRPADDQLKSVKHVVIYNAAEAEEGALTFESVLQRGRDVDAQDFFEKAVNLAQPDDLATIIYTSGTTGVPKGVLLSHRNFMSNMLDCAEVLRLTTDDRGLSFLPLSHAFERTVDYVYFYRGLSLVYSANLASLPNDLRESSPSIMANVPRFYEKVKSSIETKAGAAGAVRKAIFDWAVAVGRQKVGASMNGGVGALLRAKSLLADVLVFRKIRAGTGGNVRFFISGGAPLSADVGRFFLAAGLPILEGYGLTETSPVISVNPPERPKPGTVGKHLPSVDVRISEEGEVLTRGPSVMSGYYKMDEETAAVMEDGWFHTGDIGRVDSDGYLVITDRIKQLLVTSVGKKVAPQPIEKKVESSPFVEQILLIGEKRRFISALVVPDFDQLRLFAKDRKIGVKDPEDLVAHPVVRELFDREIETHTQGLSSYERIRKYTLLPRPFAIETGELTPTMKIKRKVVREKYADLIEKMYVSSTS